MKTAKQKRQAFIKEIKKRKKSEKGFFTEVLRRASFTSQ